jgi:membrane-anchored protein YejM (alkaline phosphatase superfamily)
VKIMIASFVCATALLMAVSAAQAECTFPKAPESVPNGSTATEAEMVAAMQTFKQYNADSTAYLACLDEETAASRKDGSLSQSDLVQMKARQLRKYNLAVDEAKEAADKFNKQLRAFKSRG